MSRVGKILVIRGGAIGDFVLSLPVLAALRQTFPKVQLEILGYPHIAGLALAGGLVDKVQSIEAQSLAMFFARNGTLSEEWRDYFAEFDIIVSYLYDPDQIFQGNVTRCTTAQFITGTFRPDETENLHATKVLLKPLERLAVFDADPIPKLSLKVRPSGESRRLIALHPGSGSERKNWPESRWSELIDLFLSASGFVPLLVGGEAERSRLKNLSNAPHRSGIRKLENIPLVELAGELSQCIGFVGHDSGISHLAAAIGLPGIVIWGDTLQEIWGPLAPRVKVIRHSDGLRGISLGEVWNAVKLHFEESAGFC